MRHGQRDDVGVSRSQPCPFDGPGFEESSTVAQTSRGSVRQTNWASAPSRTPAHGPSQQLTSRSYERYMIENTPDRLRRTDRLVAPRGLTGYYVNLDVCRGAQASCLRHPGPHASTRRPQAP